MSGEFIMRKLACLTSVAIFIAYFTATCCFAAKHNEVELASNGSLPSGVSSRLTENGESVILLIFNDTPYAVIVDSSFGDRSMRVDSDLDTTMLMKTKAGLFKVVDGGQSTLPPQVLRKSFPLSLVGPGRVIGMSILKKELTSKSAKKQCFTVAFDTKYRMVKDSITKVVRSNELPMCAP